MDPEATMWTPPQGGEVKQDLTAALGDVPLFEGLSKGELKKISRILHARTYQPGEIVFREGDAGAGMFIIRKGKVNIVIRRPDGTEQVLAPLSERQFFGEVALLDDAPRSASCVAAEATELLGFFEPDLESLIERDSKLGSKVVWNLAKLLATRLRTMNETMRLLRQPDSVSSSGL